MLKKIAFGTFLLLTLLSVIFAFRSEKKVTTASDEAYQHYLKGVELSDQFYFRQAAEEFEKAVQLDSNFAVAEMRLALAFENLGYRQKAAVVWARAESNKPHVSEREQLLIDLYLANIKSDLEKAYKIAQKYVEKYPDEREGYSNLGLGEYRKENYEKAIELFQKSLKIDPNYAQAYNMLGYLNSYMGRYDLALDALQKYIELSPNQANPHDSRGEILHSIGRYEEAIGEFREAYNISPEFDFAIMHMATSYAALGEMTQVSNCYHSLLNNAPNEIKKCQYLISWANLYMETHQYDSALVLCDRVPSIDPDPELTNLQSAWSLRGQIYYRLKDAPKMSEAWQHVKQILEERSQKTPALASNERVRRFERIVEASEADLHGDLPHAVELWSIVNDSTRQPSEKALFRLVFADALYRSGEKDKAKSELQKNLSMNPNDTRTLCKLGEILAAEGDKVAAGQHREKALLVWKNADQDFKPLTELKSKMETPLTAESGKKNTRP